MQPIIRQSRDTGERELVSLRWGLVPFWTSNLAAFKGFYEWKRIGDSQGPKKDQVKVSFAFDLTAA